MTTYISSYYEEIVNEFYAKAKVRPNKKNPEYIICKLKWKNSKFSPNDLKQAFDPPIEIDTYLNNNGKVYKKEIWNLMSISNNEDEMSICCQKKKLLKKFSFLHNIFSKAMECRTESNDQLTTLQWKLMTIVVKSKKINWALFIFNWLIKEVTKESTRKGLWISIELFNESSWD